MRPRNQAIPAPLPRPRAATRRRGTVIVLALAVLAILAIAAVAYVSIVRIDRESSVAVARQANYEQQVNAVVGHIGGLIAADLFGNKIVTNSTPKTLPGDVRVWPRAFEDAESWDYPTSDASWRNPATTQEDDPLNPADPSVARRVARPDDAWLASLEPRWNYNDLKMTRFWPQITNLRSAYTWNQRTRRWDRGDGRYVDLLQWFRQSRNNRANPAINLGEVGDGSNPMGPAFGYDDGNSNRLTGVFDLQTADLDLGVAPEFPRVLNPSDERMWVDTDGDLRPDARWQQLDSLGNLYGLNWVVAARIIDASALLNVQTAIEFPYEANAGSPPSGGRTFADVMGTGRTPADVDLLRVLSYASNNYLGDINTRPGVFDAPISIQQMDRQFEEHLRLSLGVESVINDLREVNGTAPDDMALQDPRHQYFNWSRGNPLTRVQREALFSYATSTIDRPLTPSATSYPRRDLLDFFSYYATNNSNTLSKLEQRFDGPESNQGFLPDPDSSISPTAFGPMRSAERAADIRRFDSGTTGEEPQPSSQRMKLDIRRLLTMVNGVGRISPVPVLNDAIRNRVDSFDSVYSQEKIRFSEMGGLTPSRPRDQEMVQRVFGSFVWALAPLATNQPLAPGVPGPTTGQAARQQSFNHYGAGSDGPARGWQSEIGSPIDPAASYAVLRAAALTVNTIDAMDRVQPAGSVSPRERPTIMRLWNNTEPERLIEQDATLNSPYAFEVGTRFAHGDIPPALLPQDYVGSPSAGITFFGLDRQPFLKEVHTTAMYATPLGVASSTPQVDPTNRDHQVGCIIAVELGNPWPEGIDLSDYEVRIDNGTNVITLDLATVQTGTQTIAPASSLTLYWVTPGAAAGADPGNPAFGTAFTEFVGTVGAAPSGWGQYVLSGVDVRLAPEALKINGTAFDPTADDFVVFQDFGAADNVPVILVRKATGVDGPVASTAFVVDRMSPPPGGDPFPGPLGGTYEFSLLDLPDYANPETEGYGRVVVSSSLHRRDENARGFPAYVVERRESNQSNHYEPPTNASFGEPMIQKWLDGEPGPSADFLANGFPAGTVLLDDNKGEFQVAGAGVGLPAFQLFVPDRQFEYLSELMLVTPFCNMYVHRDVSGGPAPAQPDVTLAWDITPGNQQPWITFSEQIGRQYELNYLNQSNQAANNPYLALIDPIRYSLGSASMLGLGADLPDALTIPLGLRIVEPFEALTTQTDTKLMQGRINVNTAPPEVLAALPLMAPQFNVPVGGAGAGGMNPVIDAINPITGAPNSTSRLQTLLTYRDRVAPNADPNGSLSFVQPSGITAIEGMRGSLGRTHSDPFVTRGFVSTAELAVLQPWEFPATGNLNPTFAGAGTAERYFAQLGGDSVNAGGGTPGAPTQIDSYRPYTGSGDGWQTDPIDDPEERLSIYRAISNIVTTRSDVFIAWFVLRGYDPDIIEGITVPGGNSPTLQQARDAMNDPLTGFRPTYESRWLVVYDRSNCVKPTDRPRILLQVELPAAKP